MNSLPEPSTLPHGRTLIVRIFPHLEYSTILYDNSLKAFPIATISIFKYMRITHVDQAIFRGFLTYILVFSRINSARYLPKDTLDSHPGPRCPGNYSLYSSSFTYISFGLLKPPIRWIPPGTNKCSSWWERCLSTFEHPHPCVGLAVSSRVDATWFILGVVSRYLPMTTLSCKNYMKGWMRSFRLFRWRCWSRDKCEVNRYGNEEQITAVWLSEWVDGVFHELYPLTALSANKNRICRLKVQG